MLPEPAWATAPQAFDRGLTLEVIAGLQKTVDAERAALKSGRPTTVGDALESYYLRSTEGAFISAGVGELATRLRQLDCGVRAGKIAGEVAQVRYAQIVAELAAEQRTLDPAIGGSQTRAAAP
jgi:hypothetical protein